MSPCRPSPSFSPPRHAAAAQQGAEAQARHDSVVLSLGEKQRRLAEARGELEAALKEGRQVESQVCECVCEWGGGGGRGCGGSGCGGEFCVLGGGTGLAGVALSCLFLFLCGFRHPLELTTAPRAPRACLCLPHPAPQRNRLTVQLEEVEGQLREAKRDRKETERDRRVNEAIAALKTQHKGRECAACRLLPAVYCAAALRPTQPMLCFR